jgi:NADPH-dependent glutamate synthase beta subunit-like oxidoreductase
MPIRDLTDDQLRAELARCQSCEARPCRAGCPASCSPGDFILAARAGDLAGLRRAAAHILGHDVLGGVCGAVCPEALCMARCARGAVDRPVEIPAIQAAIVRRARALGGLAAAPPPPASGQRVAIVGAGPAGLAAAATLARAGHAVHVFERARRAGGMARLIPRHRLDPGVLDADVAWALDQGDVRLALGRRVPLPRDLLSRGFAAVIVAAGLGEPAPLEVPGEARAVPWTRVLSRPPPLRGRRVAVAGDGAVAVDCAEVALARGAAHVELLALRTVAELGPEDRARLAAAGVRVTERVRIAALRRGRGGGTEVALRRVALPAAQAFHPSRLADVPRSAHVRRDLDVVVAAVGGRPGLRREPHPRIVYAGDLETGPSSVVEAVASGKRAALEVNRRLGGSDPACPDRGSCADGAGCPRRATCPEWSPPAPGAGAAA